MAGYAQRTDLIQDPTYGAKAEQRRMADTVRPGPQPSVGPGPVSMMDPATPPPILDAPTARPDEPVTAGLDIGPGPGSEALGMDTGLLTAATLRQLYMRFPDPVIAQLIARMEQR